MFIQKRLLIVFLLLLVSQTGLAVKLPGKASDCIRSAFQRLIEIVPGNIENIHLFPSKTQARRYEVKLAQQSGLEIEEVMGITRNFHDDVVFDGSTGLFVLTDKVTVDQSRNLISAYKYIKKVLAEGDLSKSTVIEMRKLGQESIVVSTRKGGRQLRRKPFRFKKTGETATVRGRLHPEVTEKLLAYGYKVDQRVSRTIITYQNPEKALETFTTRLNKMIEMDLPPEYISSYAVQELLIIHPFADGNGRTARLLGQAIYQKLTGKIVRFPSEFKVEMQHSLSDLSWKLFKHDDALEMWSLPPVKDRQSTLNEYLFMHSSSRTYFADVGPASKKVGDSPFGSFYYDNTSELAEILPAGAKIPERTPIRYEQLDDSITLSNYDGFVYFGTPVKNKPSQELSLKAARKKIDLMFQYGRSTRGAKGHRNVYRHQLAGMGKNSAKDIKSGFFQTSKDHEIVMKNFVFGQSSNKRTDYGIMYIIDPKYAQVVDVDALSKAHDMGSNVLFSESEVLFSSTLNPTRVYAAAIVRETKEGNKIVLELRLNGNYLPPGTTN